MENTSCRIKKRLLVGPESIFLISLEILSFFLQVLFRFRRYDKNNQGGQKEGREFMNVSYMIHAIFCIYTVFAGIALTAYFLSLCHEAWTDREKKRNVLSCDRKKKRSFRFMNGGKKKWFCFKNTGKRRKSHLINGINERKFCFLDLTKL